MKYHPFGLSGVLFLGAESGSAPFNEYHQDVLRSARRVTAGQKIPGRGGNLRDQF